MIFDFVISLMICINTWLVYLMFRKPEDENEQPVVSKEVRRVLAIFLAVSIMHMVAKDI